MYVIEGTMENFILREFDDICSLFGAFHKGLRELELQGYSPLRAAYILNNQEFGKNRKSMKRWARARREDARRVDRIFGDNIKRRINPFSVG